MGPNHEGKSATLGRLGRGKWKSSVSWHASVALRQWLSLFLARYPELAPLHCQQDTRVTNAHGVGAYDAAESHTINRLKLRQLFKRSRHHNSVAVHRTIKLNVSGLCSRLGLFE
eukprot:4313159-Amphidinium_carterae.1